uniref:Putative lectin/glucanase superfamily protein n=1 Tax=viral metagenome TaxID=1070528 RepID=A0A6M3IYZ5_9ZZZZ
MKKWVIALAIVGGAWGFVWAQPRSPYTGARGNGFYLSVRDDSLGTSWELVTADTGFTQMSADTTVCVAWSGQTAFDTLSTGRGGKIIAAWGLGDTADQTDDGTNTNPLLEAGTPNYTAMAFGDGWSGEVGDYLYRYDTDGDFDVNAVSFSIALFCSTRTASNPPNNLAVFSAAASPDNICLRFNTSGKLVWYITDDGSATADSVVSANDLIDGAMHFIEAGRRGANWELWVDSGPVRTTAVSKAAGDIDLDSVWIGARRVKPGGGAASVRDEFYLGKIDHILWRSDSLAVSLLPYAYHRGRQAIGLETDTTRVFVSGIKQTDSTYFWQALKVPFDVPETTSVNLHVFESAYLDSEEVMPMIVYTPGGSPRSALLDTIPAGAIHMPIAHRTFDKGMIPWLQDVTFRHLSPTDTTEWQLRAYGDLEDARDLDDGYNVLAEARTHANHPVDTQALDITLPSYSYLAVFSRASSGSVRGVSGAAIVRGKTR